MTEPATVVAAHRTVGGPVRDDVSLEELVYEAGRGALRRAGLDIGAIDLVATASSDAVDGRAISSMVTVGPAGGYGRDFVNCSSSGAHALVAAVLQILSGTTEMALVVSWGKPSEAPLDVVERLAHDPIYGRAVGPPATPMLALQVRAALAADAVSGELATGVLLEERAAAARNERSPVAEAPSAAEVDASPPLASPLREIDLPTAVDEAIALVVARGDRARELTDRGSVVRGMGWACDPTPSLGDRLPLPESLAAAATRAYAGAGLDDPAEQVDVAELADPTPYHAPLVGAALGLDGRATNPSGGHQAGWSGFGTDLRGIAEVHLQLAGEAGAVQVGRAARGVAHSSFGFATQGNTVIVLERDRGTP